MLDSLWLAGKIEIKIVTTGGFGDDDDTHWLSEEDTKNLKDIFFNILVRTYIHTNIMGRNASFLSSQHNYEIA